MLYADHSVFIMTVDESCIVFNEQGKAVLDDDERTCLETIHHVVSSCGHIMRDKFFITDRPPMVVSFLRARLPPSINPEELAIMFSRYATGIIDGLHFEWSPGFWDERQGRWQLTAE